MVQADGLGPKVGGHLAPCCTHRVNQGELSQCCFKHDDSAINIVLVLLLLLLLTYLLTYYKNMLSFIIGDQRDGRCTYGRQPARSIFIARVCYCVVFQKQINSLSPSVSRSTSMITNLYIITQWHGSWRQINEMHTSPTLRNRATLWQASRHICVITARVVDVKSKRPI